MSLEVLMPDKTALTHKTLKWLVGWHLCNWEEVSLWIPSKPTSPRLDQVDPRRLVRGIYPQGTAKRPARSVQGSPGNR